MLIGRAGRDNNDDADYVTMRDPSRLSPVCLYNCSWIQERAAATAATTSAAEAAAHTQGRLSAE